MIFVHTLLLRDEHLIVSGGTSGKWSQQTISEKNVSVASDKNNLMVCLSVNTSLRSAVISIFKRVKTLDIKERFEYLLVDIQ